MKHQRPLVTHAAEYQTPKEKAIDTFVQYLNAGTDLVLSAQVEKLKSAGFVVQSEPDAVHLGGGCGFAGCNYSFMVTITFETPYSINKQSATVAAIVKSASWLEKGIVKKVLTEDELAEYFEWN